MSEAQLDTGRERGAQRGIVLAVDRLLDRLLQLAPRLDLDLALERLLVDEVV